MSNFYLLRTNDMYLRGTLTFTALILCRNLQIVCSGFEPGTFRFGFGVAFSKKVPEGCQIKVIRWAW